ncbi:MAG: tryptophan--tRNA ligase [Candidatus Nomurabacteria bacterium]|nr:tryptophan--tRNA ligase [Candidatus Nomurabacteria bacterium]
MKNTILTGVRVNGELTLGNFLGAIFPIVQLAAKHADEYNVNIFVPDLHTIIAEVDGKLHENTMKSIKYYMATGLDTKHPNIHVYRQSYIPAHSELTWILDCFATMGETSRMIQYKEKSDGGKESANVGIFNYPILMAADILLYSAKYVPVGEDQFQHLELTRDIALRMNKKFGEIFVPPAPSREQVEFMSLDEGLRIRDLVHPEKKMSKSSRNENAKIMLSDRPEAAAKKIMSATTDSVGKIQFDMFNQAGISNLLQILSLLKREPLQDVIARWTGESSYGDLKQEVAVALKHFLQDFQEKVAEISDKTVLEVLEEGEARMRKVADAKLLEVQKAVGIRR